MTEDEIKRLLKFATGPADAYDLHHVRPLLGQLLAEHHQLRRLNEMLTERVAAQSEKASRAAEKANGPLQETT